MDRRNYSNRTNDAVLPVLHNQYQEEVSVFEAHKRIQELVRSQGQAQDIIIDAQIQPYPRGNKTWEIELTLFHVTERIGQCPRGTPYQGYIACHRSGSFTTYSVSIEGRELYFDRYENALTSLSEEGLRTNYRA